MLTHVCRKSGVQFLEAKAKSTLPGVALPLWAFVCLLLNGTLALFSLAGVKRVGD